MEWLAFEPEHAQQFARRGGFGGPPGGGRRPGDGDDDEGPGNGPPPPIRLQKGQSHPHIGDISDWADPTPPGQQSGYLHTYIAKKDLHLLYIDGMSAGKTSNGTLDSQDYVLVNDTSTRGGFFEYERAMAMCNISRDAWDGRVHGFLRMEAGFEIILCDFETDLDVRYIELAAGECKGCVEANGLRGFNYLRAVSDRYHSIGDDRVHINYENFVTAFTLPDDLFSTGERGPRMTGLSNSTLRHLRSQVDEMVLSTPDPFVHQNRDWQAVADMLVQRYATRLQYLALPEILNDEGRLSYELDFLLSSSIDYSNRSFSGETARCSRKYLPKPSAAPSLAEQVIAYVNHYICYMISSTQLPDAPKKEIVLEIIKNLQWTTWKECGPCAYDEICSIPIWPFGSEEDWLKPSCRNATGISQQGGYWGSHGPGGGRGRRGKPPNGPPVEVLADHWEM